MSFTDQRAHAVGRPQSPGARPRSSVINSVWRPGKRSTRKTGVIGARPAAPGDVTSLTPLSAGLIFRPN